MDKLTRNEALEVLAAGKSNVELARAVGSLADDPDTDPKELLPALDHPGYVAEQAAIALHRMTNTPWLQEGQPIISRRFWDQRLEGEVDRIFSQARPVDRLPLREELEKRIKEAAEVFKSFGAKEVYVFGSAAEGRIDEYSDIDMAVSGLPPGVFFRAWARAVRAFPGREMDLISLDNDGPFADYLKLEGKLQRVG